MPRSAPAVCWPAALVLISALALSACDGFQTAPLAPHETTPRALRGTHLAPTPDGLLRALPGPTGVAAVELEAVERADLLFRAESGPGALVATWESDAAAAVFQSEPSGATHQFALDLHGVTAPAVTVRLLNKAEVVASAQVSPDSTIDLGSSSDEATSFHVVRLPDGTTVIRIDTEQQATGGSYVTSSLFGVKDTFITDIEVTLGALPEGRDVIRVEAPREVLLLEAVAR